MNGTLNETDVVKGKLTPVGNIGGSLSNGERLTAVISVQKGVGGSLSLDGGLTASLSRNISTTDYTGDYTITPTAETQVLLTDGKTMAHNVVINPIPQNYGLITWNGAFLTVS